MKIFNEQIVLGFTLVLGFVFVQAQRTTERWKGQISIGFHNPIDDGKNDGFFSKHVNIPTINFGMQHMRNADWGAKLDFGFNRSSNADGSIEFKLNYTRINAQMVYNATNLLTFLPENIEIVAHAGPGLSFTKPLAPFSNNTATYLNLLAGTEFHYRITESLTIYNDVGYALSLAGKDKFNVNVDGFSFNGDLLYLTFGVSFALSGCQYC